MADKTFVTPQSLLDDSFRLGLKIMEDDCSCSNL